MVDSLRQRAWRFINVTFPERQLYVRSDGRVQFFTFSPLTQTVMAGISLLFLGWVAFTSVNVIFKDRILAAKEHHFEQMQASYESRLADLQLSYDELNGTLVTAQDQFKSVADGSKSKQRVLADLIEKKRDLKASLNGVVSGVPSPAESSADAKTLAAPPVAEIGGTGGTFEVNPPAAASALAPPFAPGNGETSSTAAQAPVLVPNLEKKSELMPDRATFLRGAVQKLAQLFRRKANASRMDASIMRVAGTQEARIAHLEVAAPALLAEAKSDVDQQTALFTRALRETGIDPKTFMTRLADAKGEGGPLLPLDVNAIGTTDEGFNTQVADTMISVGKLSEIVAALRAIPLVAPTNGEVTSGFGARIDPFNENLAFHSGVDFSGPKGTDIHVTAPGIVVFAGPRGDYGNTVEVDHGFGIRTRYGHLSAISVRVGAKLEKDAVVGKLGSTGRSTGPHVHYEVWYDNAVRDPSKFIKAGRDVLQD